MNERINQLANEAGLQPFEDCGPKYVYKMEKFAELIVKECVRYFNEDYQRNFSVLWREDLSKGIKQHFGVGE